MEIPRTDRRVKRTRRALQEALVSLILDRGYEATTVQDVVERADTGRSTFYAHFVDKDALLRSAFAELHALEPRSQRGSSASHGGSLLDFSLELFRHAGGSRRLYAALVGRRGGALVQLELERLLSDRVRVELGRLRPASRDRRSQDVVVRFVVGSFTALLTWWLDGKTTITPDELDNMYRALAQPGVASFLGVPVAALSSGSEPAGSRHADGPTTRRP